MGISQYIKEIGRGKDGARSLTRAQATDLLGQVLDGAVTDLEVGGFCLAMRIKGETPEEMAGFLDAAHARLHKLPDAGHPTVVLPSYNGARKLPVLTPLLALLLARRGVPVLVHGTATEDKRVSSASVFAALGIVFAQRTQVALGDGLHQRFNLVLAQVMAEQGDPAFLFLCVDEGDAGEGRQQQNQNVHGGHSRCKRTPV